MSIAEIRALGDNSSQESIRLQELRECALGDKEYQQLNDIGLPNNWKKLSKILASTPPSHVG